MANSCALIDPPLDLGSGAFDQLVDILLQTLLTSDSMIKYDQTIEIIHGIEINQLILYNLHTIRRTCSIKLFSQDQLGCQQHGIRLELCFGFDNLNLNTTIKTTIPGFEEEDFLIRLYPISFRIVMELFYQPLKDKPLSNSELSEMKPVQKLKTHPTGQVLSFKTIQWSGIKLYLIKKTLFKQICIWFLNLCIDFLGRLFLKLFDRLILQIMNNHLNKFELSPLFLKGFEKLGIDKISKQKQFNDQKNKFFDYSIHQQYDQNNFYPKFELKSNQYKYDNWEPKHIFVLPIGE